MHDISVIRVDQMEFMIICHIVVLIYIYVPSIIFFYAHLLSLYQELLIQMLIKWREIGMLPGWYRCLFRTIGNAILLHQVF